jgi:hypothetical protein
MRTSGFDRAQRRFAVMAVEAGWSVPEVSQAYGISRMTFYRWKADPENAFEPTPEARALKAALQAGPLTMERLHAVLRALDVQPGGRSVRSRAEAKRVERARVDHRVTERLRLLGQWDRGWGYRRLHQMLLDEGFDVSLGRVYRLYRADGLITRKQRSPMRATGRIGIPREASRPNEVWQLEAVAGKYTTMAGGFLVWQVMDAYTGEQLHFDIWHTWPAYQVGSMLRELAKVHGAPRALHVFGDFGPLNGAYGWARTQNVKLHERPHAPSPFVTRARRIPFANRPMLEQFLRE